MKKKVINRTICLSFITYLIILLWAIVFKFNAEWVKEVRIYELQDSYLERVSLIYLPFYNMFNQFKKGVYFDLDYFMNIIVYIPLGLFLKYYLKDKNKLIIFIIVMSSFIFELEQSITCIGGCDGTDFAMNVIGGIIGIYLFKLFSKINIKYIFYINLVALIIFIPLAVYSIVNTIINFDLYLL
jgi:glycopeptide antibiotics resistance protein